MAEFLRFLLTSWGKQLQDMLLPAQHALRLPKVSTTFLAACRQSRRGCSGEN